MTEPVAAFIFTARASILQEGGQWREAVILDQTLPRSEESAADEVAREDLPGGAEGRYLFRKGYNWPVSTAVADELRAAGYGHHIQPAPPPPAPPVTRVHEAPPSLNDALRAIADLTDRVAALEKATAPVGGGQGEGRKK